MQAIINATRAAKAANNAILSDLCNTIDIEKRKRNLTLSDRIPDKLVSRLAEGIRNICPQITRHTITNEYRKRKKFGIFITQQPIPMDMQMPQVLMLSPYLSHHQ